MIKIEPMKQLKTLKFQIKISGNCQIDTKIIDKSKIY